LQAFAPSVINATSGKQKSHLRAASLRVTGKQIVATILQTCHTGMSRNDSVPRILSFTV
jgi:hypothetical protein